MYVFKPNENILQTSADIFINPANCVGVMGAGLAKAIKDTHPECLEPYKNACKTQKLRIGTVFATKLLNGKTLLHFPTKNHWKEKSELRFIESGLSALNTYLISNQSKSIAVPQLGCGLGGLSWTIVRSMIMDQLSPASTFCEIQIYGK